MKSRIQPPACPRRSRARGAASVEALVALPVLILIFISLMYVRDLVVQKQAAEMQARSCAWQYAMGNCQQVPAGCAGVLSSPKTEDGHASPELYDALKEGKDDALRGDDGTGIVEHIVGSLLGPALESAFGRSVNASTSRAVDRPALYGPGTTTVSGKTHLACNLMPETPEDVAKDAWTLFAP